LKWSTEQLGCEKGLCDSAGLRHEMIIFQIPFYISQKLGNKTMIEKRDKQYPWFFQPLVILWEFLASILKLTGRLVGAIIGLLLMIIGIVLTVTVVGAPVGIPVLVVGFLLTLRSIF
jgi:hypothetical protein